MESSNPCWNCKAVGTRRGEHVGRWTFGELTITVAMPTVGCDACGEDLIHGEDLSRAENAVTRALVDADSTDPKALRWLRKAADLRANELAGLLGVAPETVSRW